MRSANTSSSNKNAISFTGWTSEKIIAAARILVTSPHDFKDKDLLRTHLQNHDEGAPRRAVVIEKLLNKLPIMQIMPDLTARLDLAHGHTSEASLEKQTGNTPETTLQTLGQLYSTRQTKRFMLLGKQRDRMLYPIILKQASTKERLQDRFTLDHSLELIDYLRSPENKDHFMLVPESGFFYGSDEGQRLCVQAAKFAQSHLHDLLEGDRKSIAMKLHDAVTREMDGLEKQTWRNVVNYWLAGKLDEGLGLAGERDHIRSNEKKSGNQPIAARNYSCKGTSNSGETDTEEAIDFSVPSQNERKQFMLQFRQAQYALNKEWVKDVKREDYQYKHKAGASAAQIDEDLINRRMCKWALHVAHYNRQPVIYALDKLDLMPVALGDILDVRNTDAQDSVKQKVSVCTTELREIFRHIDKFDSCVTFHEGLKKVSPPWGSNRPADVLRAFALYAMHLTRKLLLQHPGDQRCLENAAKMIRFSANQKWHEVIMLYKDLEPSLLRAPTPPCRKSLLIAYTSRTEKAKENSRTFSPEKINELQLVIERLTTDIRTAHTEEPSSRLKPL